MDSPLEGHHQVSDVANQRDNSRLSLGLFLGPEASPIGLWSTTVSPLEPFGWAGTSLTLSASLVYFFLHFVAADKRTLTGTLTVKKFYSTFRQSRISMYLVN